MATYLPKATSRLSQHSIYGPRHLQFREALGKVCGVFFLLFLKYGVLKTKFEASSDSSYLPYEPETNVSQANLSNHSKKIMLFLGQLKLSVAH